ncbi:MAG: sensor domain-containing diguanylate cyclase [Proteobacteria bacterium]|nr:sensor domain-containing diguanylate cyclase [Cystobacterineae bacterium]MCL2315286.1 sensor domain-containing diguanylate cyclase [Pseudomonadota bacterium]
MGSIKGTDEQAEHKIARRVKWLIAFFLICLWGMMALRGVVLYHAHRDSSAQLLRQMSAAIEDQTRNQFRLVEMFLMAADKGLVQATELNELFSNSFFQKFRKETGLFIDIYAVDLEGRLYNITSAEQEALTFVHDREYFDRFPTTNIRIFPPVKSRVSDNWIIPIILPLSSPHNKIRMLLIALKVDALADLYEQQRPKPNGSVALFRDDGILLMQTPGGHTKAFGKNYSKNIEKLFQDQKDATVFLSNSIFDNTAQLTSYKPLKAFPLSIMVSVAHRDIMEKFWKDLGVLIAWTVIATATILLTGKQHIRLLAEQTILNSEIFRIATIDALTGVLNRRRFIEIMEHEFSRSRRYGNPLSLLMFDLDYFKQVNDTYGHQMGDKILVAFANTVAENLRTVDFFARFGGEEFVVLLPQTPIGAAKLLAERICKKIGQMQISVEQGKISFSTSIGVAAIQPTDMKPEEMIHRADKSLYEAKSNGRNQVGPLD